MLWWGSFAMTDKQKQFVETLLCTGDGEEALRVAGYAPPWTVKRVLGEKSMQAYLTGRETADAGEVAAFFSAVMRGEPAADERPPGVKDQLKAAELLGKHFGMFTERESRDEGRQVEFFGDELL